MLTLGYIFTGMIICGLYSKNWCFSWYYILVLAVNRILGGLFYNGMLY
jgi:hypothetical protein